MPSNKPDHYATLGVFRDASQDEIKRAYFDAAQRLHPDKNVAAGETELFLEIQQAYEILSNPKRRNLYDATLPPEIDVNSVVKHEIYFSRPNLVRMGESQLIYALLEVSPREEKESLPTPPLNICLVLDRSTSMQGDKMDMVKATAIQLLRGLRPQDVLSVVTFSDRAEVIVPAGLNQDNKKQEGRIQMIQASGATEIFNGLEAGLKEIRRTLDPSRVNHIILLTDGQTYGDEQACLQLAEEAASQNIGITGMGIGHEWNDIFLDALASKTGGSSAYISKPKDIQRLLVDKFNALISTYADDVILEFNEQEHVKINYAFRLQPEGGPVEMDSPLHLGPILRDTPLHVLFEILVSPSALTGDELTLLIGSLKTSITARPTPVPPIRLNLVREVHSNPSPEPPPTRILSALSRLTLYRMQERARAAADAGQFDVAVRHLQNLATHLLSQGENSLAKTALFEADNLEKMHAWSASGNKDIKYSTRALLLAGTKEKGKMIVCSNCKHTNMDGAMFCAECGAQLVGRDNLITQTITTEQFAKATEQKKSTNDMYQPFDGSDAWGSLHLLDTGQVLPLSSRLEFTMGRISEGQPIMPDIDLSPYQAYAAGVSRLHGVIKKEGGRIIFMDLGSANGTYINGKRLAPNAEQVLNHGDIIALGKLKMQILVKNI